MLFSSPTFQSEIHKTANDKQQITLHIKNTVSCNAQSSVESHKATKLFRHQHAINHHHLPHCTDALQELLVRDHVNICIFVTVPYFGMCIIVSVCCAWPMTLFSASLISPLEGACIDGHGQLLCQDGIQKPWMAWWVGTHASSRTPRYHCGYPYERETENRAYAKVKQQNLMGIYTNLCASKWLSVASTVIIMALQKGKGGKKLAWIDVKA